jgi:thymidylate kinase
MSLIVLFGPDGSGKTTLTRGLIRELKKLNRNIVYIKMKSHHLAAYFVLKLLQKLKCIPETSSPRIIDYNLRRIFGKSKMYLLLEFLSIMLWYFFFVKPRLSRNNIVVADRFSPDSVASLYTISKSLPSICRKILLNLCRKSIAIYVRSEPYVLLTRKAEENLSETYLRYLLVLYDDITREVALIAKSLLIMDTTSLPKSQSIRRIVEFAKKYLIPML